MSDLPPDLDAATPLLGGLSPRRFMSRHWHRRPLLVRAAGAPLALSRSALFELAGREDVESRLVQRDGARWRVRHGPLARRALPPVSRPGWTLLVQGLDLHVEAAHALLQRFAFVPAARLDDLMVSWASDGGGVGPHLDSYDVFLLQLQGRRRWRIAPARTAEARAFVDGLPLKILRRFEPTDEWVLEPGDLLYLPPGWAHDGVAEGGECMTASIGFRAPTAGELVRELLGRIGDEAAHVEDVPAADAHGSGSHRRARERARAMARRYADAGQPATDRPGAVPPALVDFARQQLARALAEPGVIERALGTWLSEPKASVWFDAPVAAPRRRRSGAAGPTGPAGLTGLVLDRRTRMLHDAAHVYLNGEAFRAAGRDAALLRRLADRRRLDAPAVAGFSAAARAVVDEWLAAGWVHAMPPSGHEALAVGDGRRRKDER